MLKLLGTTTAALLIAIVGAAPALGATTYYASPGGSGTTCSQLNPCSLDTAVETVATNGDEVVVGPGSYTPSSGLLVASDIHVHGVAGSIPTIDPGSFDVNVDSPNAKLGDVKIDANNNFNALALRDGTVERVFAHEAGTPAFACNQAPGPFGSTLRDSVCWADGTSGTGLGTSASPGNGTFAAKLRNVTAMGLGSSGRGMDYAVNNSTGTTTYSIDAKDVIAQGTTTDVKATGTGTTTTTMNIALDHSNFAATSVSQGSITSPSTANNQTMSPVFENGGAGGDFHQLASSPTIDAGDTDASSGSADFEGDARVLDGNDDCTAVADIGADEFVDPTPTDCNPPPPPPPPLDTTAPDTLLGKVPKKMIRSKSKKVKVRIEFSATEPGSFECSLDGADFSSCISPFTAKVKRGKHSFQVRAKDGAGNVDQSPAALAFKVKKKKKKK